MYSGIQIYNKNTITIQKVIQYTIDYYHDHLEQIKTNYAGLNGKKKGVYFKDVPIEDMLTMKGRQKDMVYIRSFIYKYLRINTDMPLYMIGNAFNRHHATVINGLVNFENLLFQDQITGTDKTISEFRKFEKYLNTKFIYR